MMGISHSESKSLSWWEFTAIRYQWNERHTIEEDEPVEPPTVEWMMERDAVLAAKGYTVQ